MSSAVDSDAILEKERIERIASSQGRIESIFQAYNQRKESARHYLHADLESVTGHQIKQMIDLCDKMILEALNLPKPCNSK